MQQVEKKFPGDKDKLARMSLIEGTSLALTSRHRSAIRATCRARAATMRQDTGYRRLTRARTEGFPQSVRMANLACIGSRKVNGVAELHSELVRITIMKDFVDFFGVSK